VNVIAVSTLGDVVVASVVIIKVWKNYARSGAELCRDLHSERLLVYCGPHTTSTSTVNSQLFMPNLRLTYLLQTRM